jgi:hypothetical protein
MRPPGPSSHAPRIPVAVVAALAVTVGIFDTRNADVATHNAAVATRVAAAVVAAAVLFSGKDLSLRGMFGVLARCASGRRAGSAAGGLLVGAGWQVMCVAARLMPPAMAGGGWPKPPASCSRSRPRSAPQPSATTSSPSPQ